MRQEKDDAIKAMKKCF